MYEQSGLRIAVRRVRIPRPGEPDALTRQQEAALRRAAARRGPRDSAIIGLPVRLAWMDTERLNLHAAVDYAAHHDRPSHAIAIPAAMHGFLHTQGHWGQALALYHIALNAAHHTTDQLAKARTLGHLGPPAAADRGLPGGHHQLDPGR